MVFMDLSKNSARDTGITCLTEQSRSRCKGDAVSFEGVGWLADLGWLLKGCDG